MAEPDIQRYLDGIESQHKTKPRFMAHMEALLKKVDDVTICVKDMPAAFDLNKAVGAQLDIVGELAGIDRRYVLEEVKADYDFLDDDMFRYVTKMQIVSNAWDGTGESLHEMWNNTFDGQIEVSWFDNQDMTMELYLFGDVPLDLVRLIERGYYIPKPMGVGTHVTVIEREHHGEATAYMATAPLSIKARMSAVAYNIDMEG